jgi:hypothetical protein
MKTFVQDIAHQTSLTYGPLVQAAINLTAAQDEQTVINVAAGERWVIEKIEIICDAAGTVALWSGPVATGNRVTGDMALAANAQYVFTDLFSQASAHDFIINRATSVAVRGTVTYRVLA